MTIERELLRKIVDYMWEGELVDEIKELLAQPEHIVDVTDKVEPVAWMYEWEEIGGKEWTSVKNGKYPPIVEEEYCMRNLRPLYTAQPKREPLSAETIAKLWGESYSGTTQMVRDFARAIEKAHGIGGDDD
jgi:hypothetical protein